MLHDPVGFDTTRIRKGASRPPWRPAITRAMDPTSQPETCVAIARPATRRGRSNSKSHTSGTRHVEHAAPLARREAGRARVDRNAAASSPYPASHLGLPRETEASSPSLAGTTPDTGGGAGAGPGSVEGVLVVQRIGDRRFVVKVSEAGGCVLLEAAPVPEGGVADGSPGAAGAKRLPVTRLQVSVASAAAAVDSALSTLAALDRGRRLRVWARLTRWLRAAGSGPEDGGAGAALALDVPSVPQRGGRRDRAAGAAATHGGGDAGRRQAQLGSLRRRVAGASARPQTRDSGMLRSRPPAGEATTARKGEGGSHGAQRRVRRERERLTGSAVPGGRSLPSRSPPATAHPPRSGGAQLALPARAAATRRPSSQGAGPPRLASPAQARPEPVPRSAPVTLPTSPIASAPRGGYRGQGKRGSPNALPSAKELSLRANLPPCAQRATPLEPLVAAGHDVRGRSRLTSRRAGGRSGGGAASGQRSK